jgi:tetratricopeptide (TPR) repeat protein
VAETPPAGQLDYAAFELLVGARAADGYPVTITHAPAGEASGACRLDPTADDLQAALARIEAGQADEHFLAEFGRHLFDALFPDPVAALLRTSLGLAKGQGKGLRLRLRLEPPELAALPWEYLYCAEQDCFLALSAETPLVRYVAMPYPSRPMAISPPLRVLVVLSSPKGAVPLDVGQEKGIVEGALRDCVDQGLVQLYVVERGVAADIGQAMRAFRPHVFHFVGHGQYRGDKATVVLEDRAGRAQFVGARTFREFFLGIADTRLAVLNACQLATTSSTRPLAGLAPHLLQRNLSAVVAMQSPIADDMAMIFSREFYRSLALGYPVDGAVAEARKGILLETGGGMPDWGIPVLFLRAQDGRLFEVGEAEAARPEVPPPPEPAPPPEVPGFVGREAELAYFAEKLAASGLAVVAGMPGVGKTALAAVLADRIGEPGRTLWHSFHEGEGIEEIIWKLAAFLFWQGGEQEVLWRMLQLARLTGGQPPPTRQLLDYLAQMIRGRGYLLCLDEWQFLSEEEADLLDRFVGRLSGQDTSFIIASQVVPGFVRAADFEPLAGLSRQDTHRLLAERDLSLSDDLEAELYARTGGNAQFLTLAVDALRSAGDPARLIERLAETDDIERFLMSEVDGGLTGEERAVMSGVAVLLGYPGTRDAVEAVLETGRLKRTLIDLSHRHLLTAHQGEVDEEYGQNAVVQAFYYHLLSRRERREMHRRAGAYYETEELDALRAARHLERTGEYERAVGLVTDDVWSLINRGRARGLRLLLERFTVQELTSVSWARVNIALGLIYDILGEHQLAQKSNQEALATLAKLPDSARVRELEAQACRSMGETLKYESPRDALGWLNQGLDRLAGGSVYEEAALYLQVGSVQITMGDYTLALRAVQRGLELLPEGPSQLRVDGLINLGAIHFAQGDLERAKTYAQRALEAGQSLHDHWRTISIWSNLGIYKYVEGDRGGAIADYRQALELAERLGSDAQRTRLGVNLGIMCLHQGDHDAAQAHLSGSLDLARQGNLREFQVGCLLYLALLRLYQGEERAAEPLLTEAERLALEMDLKYQLPEIYRGWAVLKLAVGQLEAALERAEGSLRVARELEAGLEEGMSLRVVGQALLANDQTKAAFRAFEQSLSLLEGQDPYEAARTRAQWGLALISRDADEAGRLLEKAQATFEELGAMRDLAAVKETLEA